MFGDTKVAHIVAVGENGEIGGNNELLWHIPEDLRFFKDMTIGRVVLMGRKTIESLPKPLSRRILIEVTRNSWSDNFSNEDILYSRLTVASELSKGLSSDKIFVAGGASIYKATEKYVDELYVTHIQQTFPAADKFYGIPEGFVNVGDVIPLTHSVNGLWFKVTKYERQSI